MKPAPYRPGPLVWPIPEAELVDLKLLHRTTKVLRDMPFDEIVKVPYLIGGLRRTLQARQYVMAQAKARAAAQAAEFELT